MDRQSCEFWSDPVILARPCPGPKGTLEPELGLLDAPSRARLKRPCSVSRTEMVMDEAQFGVYIIDIYIYMLGQKGLKYTAFWRETHSIA